MFLGHIGLTMLVIGATLYYAWEFDSHLLMKTNDKVTVKEYNVVLHKISYGKKENYLFRRAHLDIEKNNKIIGSLTPEIRFYPIEKSFTYESAILHNFSGDIYLTIGEIDKENKITVKMQYKPFIYLIWLSIALMFSSVIIYLMKRK